MGGSVVSQTMFEGWRAPPDFVSDGCTFLRDRIFHVDIKDACRLHDFLRRYRIVSAARADAILRRHWIALGVPSWAAWPLWALVRAGSLWFTRTQPLPARWAEYAYQAPPPPGIKA
jgi:hypothetical protein